MRLNSNLLISTPFHALMVVVLTVLGMVSCKRQLEQSRSQTAESVVAGLKKECDRGKASVKSRACLKVATAYYKGHGTARALPVAAKFFERACEAGEPEGCFHLGSMLENGEGVKKDAAEALKRYVQACRGKVGPGCFGAGRLHFQPEEGVVRDLVQATELFKKSCDLPHKYQGVSCFYVGAAFLSGTGVPRSEQQCAVFMRKSCKLGDRNGCAGLAAMHEKGLGGVKKDLAEARRLYQKACLDGVLAACEAVKALDQKAAPPPMSPSPTSPPPMAGTAPPPMSAMKPTTTKAAK